MLKKIAGSLVGLSILITPLAASAQSATDASSANAALIATLIQLVQVLERELQQLLAQHNQPSQPVAVFSSSPTSGTAPVTVTFTEKMAGGYKIDFGDGSNGCSVSNDTLNCFVPSSFTHTYTSPGMYTAVVSQLTPARTVQTMTITVAGPSAEPSAAIDPGSLVASTGEKDAALVSITGTANVPYVRLVIVNPSGGSASDLYQSGYLQVTNGRWSATAPSIPVGTYPLELNGSSGPNGAGSYGTLATGVLTVSGNSQLSCSVSTDKVTYNFGDAIGLSWASTGASYLAFVPDTSGKDNLNPPQLSGKLAASGSATISANVSGNPSITLVAYGSNGETQSCTKVIPVHSVQPSASIDQSSLVASTGEKDAALATITGTASNVGEVVISIKGQISAYASVIHGAWSGTIGNLYPNTYTVQVSDNDAGSHQGALLASGTLLVAAGTPSSVVSIGACPQNAAAYRGHNGAEYSCTCPSGGTAGPLWGDGVGGSSGRYYADNSDICTAGAQAGQMNLSSGGEVDFTIDAGQNSYASFVQNGITSSSYGWWPGSFRITGPKG